MIPKCLNPVVCNDCRPISLQCTPARVFEGLILDQMTKFLEGTNFFYERQFGFRKSMSCELAVLDLVEGIRRDIAAGMVVLVAFEDFTVAFNCLFGSVIIEQLIAAGFSYSAARVIANMLTGRMFRVVHGKLMSDWVTYHRGIGQGGG